MSENEQSAQNDDYDGDMGGHGHSLREQDRFLPIANISRIMKKSLPQNAKISKEAKEIVQECVSEFISFITSEASEKCSTEKRKTINGEDLLYALQNLGFDNYYEPLKHYLGKYRDQGEKTQTTPKGNRSPKYPGKKDSMEGLNNNNNNNNNVMYSSNYSGLVGVCFFYFFIYLHFIYIYLHLFTII